MYSFYLKELRTFLFKRVMFCFYSKEFVLFLFTEGTYSFFECGVLYTCGGLKRKLNDCNVKNI